MAGARDADLLGSLWGTEIEGQITGLSRHGTESNASGLVSQRRKP